MTNIVYLVRHAAPPEPARGRYWGVGDPGTDAASLVDAASLPRLMWEKPCRLVTSPLARCVRTADALAGPLGMDVSQDPTLAEIDFGLLDGLNFTEISRDYPGEADAWARLGDHYVFPQGEAIQAFFHRATDSWKRWCNADHNAVLLVSHAGVISSWMCLFLGLPLSKRFLFSPAYAALTAFVREKDGAGWKLAFFNNRI